MIAHARHSDKQQVGLLIASGFLGPLARGTKRSLEMDTHDDMKRFRQDISTTQQSSLQLSQPVARPMRRELDMNIDDADQAKHMRPSEAATDEVPFPREEVIAEVLSIAESRLGSVDESGSSFETEVPEEQVILKVCAQQTPCGLVVGLVHSDEGNVMRALVCGDKLYFVDPDVYINDMPMAVYVAAPWAWQMMTE